MPKYTCELAQPFELMQCQQTRILFCRLSSFYGLISLSPVVDCGPLPSPVNGTISFTQTVFNSSALYSCDNGYLPSGPTMRTCQENGAWSGNNTTCERML